MSSWLVCLTALLLQLFALLQVSLQTARSLQAERQSEQCRDLRALLKLLTHITQSNIVEAAVPSRVCDTAGPGPGSAATAAGAQPGSANGHQNGTAAAEEGTLDVAQVCVVLIGINGVVVLKCACCKCSVECHGCGRGQLTLRST